MSTDQGGRSPSPGSTIDENALSTYPSSPVRVDHDTQMSMQHILGASRDTPSKHTDMMDEDDDAPTPGADVPASASAPRKKKADASGSAANTSIYSGNKVRHLKKDDGEPLWRKDIQYDFLKLIFENDKAVFTNSYTISRTLQTFSDLYIDAMARSSKTSKILREKLLTEREPAKNMAMVCLLVNLGRMNTTLNCESGIRHHKSGLTECSLPRNARPTSNIPCNSLVTSSPRPQLLQATSRCSSSEVYPQRRLRR